MVSPDLSVEADPAFKQRRFLDISRTIVAGGSIAGMLLNFPGFYDEGEIDFMKHREREYRGFFLKVL